MGSDSSLYLFCQQVIALLFCPEFLPEFKQLLVRLFIEEKVVQSLVCQIFRFLAFSPRNLRFSGGEFHQAGIEIGTKTGTLVVITIICIDIFTRVLALQSGLAPTDYPTVTFMQFTRQVIRMKPSLPSGFILILDGDIHPAFNL